MIFKSCV